MIELLSTLFLAVPFVLALLLGIALVAYGLLGLAKPRFLVYPFLIVLLTVSGNTYGALDQSARSLYSRGAGLLFFSIFSWALLASLLWSQLATRYQERVPLDCNLRPWVWGWCLLLLGHLGVGLMLGVPFADVLSGYGFINLLWMGVLVLLMLSALSEPAELDEFTKLLLLVALGRTLFGLVRWVAFGGDPTNAYANRHGLDLKLTFFDINDNLVCMLAMAVAGMRLFRAERRPQSRFWQLLCWGMIVLAPLCIALSFRRTAWFGFIMAAAFALWFLPTRLRLRAILLGVPVVILGFAYAAIKRLSQTKGGGGLERLFFEFQDRGIGAVSARKLELLLAWNDFLSHPLAGLGAWGHYMGSNLISWQEGEAGGAFLHSGVLHIGLKAGVLGLVLLFGLYLAFGRFVLRERRHVDERHMPLFVAGACGIIFMLPDMLIGTPVPQLRTMLVMGMCFALPYLAAQRRAQGGLPQARTQALAATPAAAQS